jgi:hypothetical protein
MSKINHKIMPCKCVLILELLLEPLFEEEDENNEGEANSKLGAMGVKSREEPKKRARKLMKRPGHERREAAIQDLLANSSKNEGKEELANWNKDVSIDYLLDLGRRTKI